MDLEAGHHLYLFYDYSIKLGESITLKMKQTSLKASALAISYHTQKSLENI